MKPRMLLAALALTTLAAPLVPGAAMANPNGCPPGLAKMNPPCVPPGLAKKGVTTHDVVGHDWVGRTLDGSTVVYFDEYRSYNLAPLPAGSRYALVDGNIVVINSQSYEVLQWINLVSALVK